MPWCVSERDTDKATRAFTEALRLGLSSANIFYSIGAEYEQAGRLKLAEGAYRNAHARDPADFDSEFALARVLAAQNSIDEALGMLEKLEEETVVDTSISNARAKLVKDQITAIVDVSS